MWTKYSYQHFRRYIDYFSSHHPVFDKLSTMPPIVSHHKIEKLKGQIKQCENGRGILVHCGDCAEPFEHVDKNILTQKINFYKKMKELIRSHHKKPPTIIGRIAGQYAKPRSSEFTTHNGKQIHNYKGDNVNSQHHDEREPCTNRLFQGYNNAVITHNFIQNSMDTLYTSHQGLILPYEAALTQNIGDKHYCLSSHMLWIGQRTRQLDGAHMEFFRGLSNPIGIKISDKITEEQFLQIFHKLNPLNEEGKLLVIVRMGHSQLHDKLRHLIEVKLKNNLNFLFVSDPMHGNTFQTKQKKIKTRHFDHILSELIIFEEHMSRSKLPYGISLESSHENVTQCIGGSHPLSQEELEEESYRSKCDPRLNPGQLQKLLKSINFI